MLTAWVPAERSARLYGEYVGQTGQTHTEPQKLLSSVSHISLTPSHKGVANRLYATALFRPLSGRVHHTTSAGFCLSLPPPFGGGFSLCHTGLHDEAQGVVRGEVIMGRPASSG